jgi:hypothetical protein
MQIVKFFCRRHGRGSAHFENILKFIGDVVIRSDMGSEDDDGD